MSNVESTYKNFKGDELKIVLFIDLKSEIIEDLYFKGNLTFQHEKEIEEMTNLLLNKSYKQALNLKPESLKYSHLTSNVKRPIASLPLWLIQQAIEEYLGSAAPLQNQNDLLCLCFGIGLSEIKHQVLIRTDYGLKEIVAETMASSACGSCRDQLIKTMANLREEYGLIQGLSHSQSRLDKDGHWVKIKGMYPSELLIKLDDLKVKWMKREGIENQFQIEIKNIEGYHIWLSVSPNEDRVRNEKVLAALSDFWRSEVGALFFLHLFV